MEDRTKYIIELEDKINRAYQIPDIYRDVLLKDINSLCLKITQSFNGDCMHEDIKEDKMDILSYGEKVLARAKEAQRGKMTQKKSKIFISHASKDGHYVGLLVSFLEDIGIQREDLFCSSVMPYGVPEGEDIYEYLKIQFHEYNLYVIFLLSENYYSSIACLNEMGAAWVLSCFQTAFLLPSFEFKEIKGAINPNRIGIKFQYDYDENEMYYIKGRISEFRKKIEGVLGIKREIPQWEKRRDEFIKNMSLIEDKQLL